MKMNMGYSLAVCGLVWTSIASAQTEPTVKPVVTTEPVTATQSASAVEKKSSGWYVDVSPYGLAINQKGDVTVKGRKAHLDVSTEEILDHLDAGVMGAMRVGRGNWFVFTEVMYMKLEADAAHKIEIDFEQLWVSSGLGYTVNEHLELFTGANYNQLDGEISGGALLDRSDTKRWVDPFIGADTSFPLTKTLSAHARTDLGGFGVGSDLMYQAFPYLNWQFIDWCSLQAGYRWLYMDYEDESEDFEYDILSEGVQVGLTGHF
ncbi:MAG: hypothetical protein FJ220_05635 [Kiritimatiellaceae bacterium]|nr:hypothetical protein [Kiritimatiellaceae bacterium]